MIVELPPCRNAIASVAFCSAKGRSFAERKTTMSHAEERKSPPVAAALALVSVGLLLIYFAPFTAILIDELVLGTYLFANNSPPWLGAAFQTIYWPLLWLMGVA
jgi:hypothetical protein